MTTTAYLDLFIRSVSEPALLHTFLSFILLHRHDSVHILDTLVSRINTPFQVITILFWMSAIYIKRSKKTVHTWEWATEQLLVTLLY